MSLKLGTTDIAGLATNKVCNTNQLLEARWFDHILNSVEWLRADTFSWHSGSAYISSYNHLVADLQNVSSETETIGSYTITFYRATDGHKIVLPDQETTVANIYSETGIAWYFILDTNNVQFKFPRTKFGFEGVRTNVGDVIEAGLPNITGELITLPVSSATGALSIDGSTSSNMAIGAGSWNYTKVGLDASNSSSIYGNSTTVQEPATQMYLYFFVGNYSQTAIEQTAGLNSEILNGKVDIASCVQIYPVIETYSNGASWYRIYGDGWCEQGGTITFTGGTSTVYFVKTFADVNYNACVTPNNQTNYAYGAGVQSKTTSNMVIRGALYSGGSVGIDSDWQASGYLADGEY